MKREAVVTAVVIGALVLLLAAVFVASQPVDEGPMSASGDTNLTNLVLSGNLDAGGTLNYGSQNLYPVGFSTPGKEFASGVIATPVQKATVPASVHGLATVEAVECSPRTVAFAGAWTCYAQVGTSNQLTLTLLTSGATPVPTASYGGIRWMAAGK